MIRRLAQWLGIRSRRSTDAFAFEEVATLDARTVALFERSFNAPPPDFPRHFVVRKVQDPDRAVCGYIHYTEFESGVYLLGGLCVDARLYRRLAPEIRSEIAGNGSLSRWLLTRSIDELGPKRAVFAHTGNTMSRRDGEAVGFVQASGQHLIVQWHDETLDTRAALVQRVEALGPF